MSLLIAFEWTIFALDIKLILFQYMCILIFFISVQAAHQSGEDEVSLSTMGRAYTIDFNSMQQINEDTGTARSVQRKVNPFASIPTQPGSGKRNMR